MTAALVLISTAVAAGALAFAMSLFIVRRGLLPDRPNGRSSHDRPTPRAGGYAIFAGYAVGLLLYMALIARSGAGGSYAPALGFAFAAFAFGAADDARPLGARVKLLAQAAIATAFVWFYGPLEQFPAPIAGSIDLGAAGYPLTIFWIVAFMNAYNFMDGVDGIAGACAIFVLAALAVAASGGEAFWAAPAIILSAAVFGFLPLNIAGGRIFMGDSGSQFVGFEIASFAVVMSGETGSTLSPLFTPLAFLPFLVDVAFTLAHRLRRGRNVLKAHNEHVYQLLVRMGRSHPAVAAIYLALVAMSTAVAILVNGMGPAAQYAAVLALAAIFAALALAVFNRARAAGLLDERGADASPEKREPAPAVRAAAE